MLKKRFSIRRSGLAPLHTAPPTESDDTRNFIRMSSIRILETFLAVAAEGSFAAAAPRVALTQAAVGQQMRALETQLRRPLFERQGKAVTLNSTGRELLPQVHKLVAAYHQMLAGAPTAQPMAGTLHLGAVVSAVRPLVQATLSLKARHPGLVLHVSAAKSIELLERVDGGALDGAIAVREPGPARAGLVWTPLYDEPMVLLTSRATERASARALLQRHPFIRFDRSQHTGQLVERALKKLRAKPQEMLELNAVEGIVDLVRSGLGVAIVPQLHDSHWQSDTRLRLVDLPQAEVRQVALVQRREAANAAILAAVVREFQARLNSDA